MTITEHLERGADQADDQTCEAVIPFAGINWPCVEPAVGRFRRACVHEHIREGFLCQGHADSQGMCRTCWELPGDLSHECPIGLTGVTA